MVGVLRLRCRSEGKTRRGHRDRWTSLRDEAARRAREWAEHQDAKHQDEAGKR